MLDVLVKFSELSQRFEAMETLNRIAKIICIVLLIFGLLNALLGYRLLRFWVMLVGFAVGGIAGGVGAHHFQLDQYMVVGCAAAGAVLLAAVAFLIYKAGIFILCGGIGWGVSIYLVHPTTSLSFFLCILFGVGLGILGVRFAKPVIIAGTSIQGGMTAGLAAAQLMGWQKIPHGILVGILVAGLGILIQTLTNRTSYEEEEEEEEYGYQDYEYETPRYRGRMGNEGDRYEEEYEEDWEESQRPLYQKGPYYGDSSYEQEKPQRRASRREFYEDRERR